MFEPTWIWPNFTLGQLFMWIGGSFEKKIQSGAKNVIKVLYFKVLTWEKNVVFLQSKTYSRFRWYSFVFERTQSRLVYWLTLLFLVQMINWWGSLLRHIPVLDIYIYIYMWVPPPPPMGWLMARLMGWLDGKPVSMTILTWELGETSTWCYQSGFSIGILFVKAKPCEATISYPWDLGTWSWM